MSSSSSSRIVAHDPLCLPVFRCGRWTFVPAATTERKDDQLMTQPMPPLDETIADRLVDGLFEEIDRLRVTEPELAERLAWQHVNGASARYA